MATPKKTAPKKKTTGATKKQPAGKTAVTVMNIEYGETVEVPLKEIHTNLGNTRKKPHSRESISELAESMKSVGIINPLTIIVHEGKKELVSGWRRFDAANFAKLKHVPVREAKTDVKGAKLIQFIENCQREDIDALEERDAFNEWLGNGLKAADIAAMIGVSEKYVYQRISLNRLISDVEKIFSEGSITLTTALEFCKLAPNRQTDLLMLITQPGMTPDQSATYSNDTRTIRKFITDISTDLNVAVFDTNDETLVENVPACVNCQKRSGCMKTLFGDITNDDICFDRDCFAIKTQTHFSQQAKNLEAEGKTVYRITNQHYSNESAQGSGFDYSAHQITAIRVDEPGYDDVETEVYGILEGSNNLGERGLMYKIISVEPKGDDQDDDFEAGERKHTRSAPITPEEKAAREAAMEITTALTSPVISLDKIPFRFLQWIGFNLFRKMDSSEQKNFAKEFGMECSEGGKKITHKNLDDISIKDFYFHSTGRWSTESEQKNIIPLINAMLLYDITGDWSFDTTNQDWKTTIMQDLAGSLGVSIQPILTEVGERHGVEILPF